MLRLPLLLVICDAARAAVRAVRHPVSPVTRDLRMRTPKLQGNVKSCAIELSLGCPRFAGS